MHDANSAEPVNSPSPFQRQAASGLGAARVSVTNAPLAADHDARSAALAVARKKGGAPAHGAVVVLRILVAACIHP
jgi:hypothetical protein